MKNNKKNIASSALIMAILSAGCSAADERADAYYGYSAPAPAASSIVSYGSSEADNVTSGSDTSTDESEIKPSGIVCTIDRDKISSSNSVPAESSNDNAASDPEIGPSGIVCTVDWDSSSSASENGSKTKYPDIVYYANQNGADSAPVTVSNSASDIKKICGIKSKVETDIGACIVDTRNDHNPYDVAYDYGKDYDAFVGACDWSLVFDADFYAESFPLLAMQYHNDKDLLLEHFQTIGIHEGRQGSKSFNVGAYKANCASDIRSAFGDNYEGYYFYYMLNYASEKSVNASGSELRQKTIMTALQAAELKGVNMYRREVGVFEIKFDSELAAYANYRAYLNSHDGWKAHDWLRTNEDVANYIMRMYDAPSMSENTTTRTCTEVNCTSHKCNYGETRYEDYRASKSHYEAMVAAKYDLIGTGNCYKADGVVSQFDAFINL